MDFRLETSTLRKIGGLGALRDRDPPVRNSPPTTRLLGRRIGQQTPTTRRRPCGRTKVSHL